MAYKIMIQGTMSSAGKSFIVTALCRIFSDLGYKVAPFKSQNMALNSGVTFDGKEMGRAQIVQAEAARTIPDVRMNPILLKPNSDTGSQVIVMGKPVGNMKAREYYEYKKSLIPIVKEAFYSLEKEYDIIVVEGAGSPAEINLKENDIVNMGLASMLDIPVLLAGDIDLGGVFAQLLGTLEWLSDEEKNRIKGLIINKFRGDVSLLENGIQMLEERCKKSVIGVIPYCKASIDEEDSVTVDLDRSSIRSEKNTNLKSVSECIKNEGSSEGISLNIDVIRLPHMSNFTDFTPLKRVEGVSVKYVTEMSETIPDLIIIPGTKSTISDIKWMKETGLFDYIKSIQGKVPIIGICGGNQILGESVSDPEGVEGDQYSEGLGLISQNTVIGKEKVLKKTSGILKCEKGFFKCLNEVCYEGYEIHSGHTDYRECSEDVFGTYVHGIFDKADVTKSLVKGLIYRKYGDFRDAKGNGDSLHDIEKMTQSIVESITDYMDAKDLEYDKAAATVKDAIDMKKLFEIMGIENKNEF